MRMWMAPPQAMCDRHLLGEHAEIHMLAGTLAKGHPIDAFIAKDLLEPASMRPRHEELATEMCARGFRHDSPLTESAESDMRALPSRLRDHRIDRERAARELLQRCERCAARSGTTGS